MHATTIIFVVGASALHTVMAAVNDAATSPPLATLPAEEDFNTITGTPMEIPPEHQEPAWFVPALIGLVVAIVLLVAGLVAICVLLKKNRDSKRRELMAIRGLRHIDNFVLDSVTSGEKPTKPTRVSNIKFKRPTVTLSPKSSLATKPSPLVGSLVLPLPQTPPPVSTHNWHDISLGGTNGQATHAFFSDDDIFNTDKVVV